METGAAAGSGAAGQYSEELGGPRMAGQMAGAVIPSLATASARLAAHEFTQLQETVAGYARIGVDPSLGLATKSTLLQGAENFLSLLPTSSGFIRRSATRMQRQFQARTERIIASLTRSPGGMLASPERAGRLINSGLRDGYLGRFHAVSRNLYDQADGLIRPGWYSIRNTQEAFREMLNRLPDAPNLNQLPMFQNPQMRDVFEAIGQDSTQNGRLTFETIRGLRSEIGAVISNPDLLPDVNTASLKRLYGALSDDILDAAHLNARNVPGNERAVLAVTRANNFYRAGLDRLEDTLKTVWSKVEGLGYTPEAIYKSAISEAAEGPTILRSLRKSLTDREWRVVSASMLRRLGKVAGKEQAFAGQTFSADTFLTNWNNLSTAARRELFDRPGWEAYTGDINAIASNMTEIRAAREVLVQQTSDASRQATLFTIGGAATAVLSGNTTAMAITGAMAFATSGSAALLSNPNFVHWLARTQRMPLERLPGHIARLSKEDFDDPAVTAAVADFVGLFRGATGISEMQREAEQKAP